MIEQLIEDPLLNPLFLPTLWRVLLVFIIGFLLIISLNKGRLKGIWETSVGKRYIGWLIIVPLYIVAVFFNGLVGLLLLLLLQFLLTQEFITLSKLHYYRPTLIGLAFTASLLAVFTPEFLFFVPILFLLIIAVVSISENDADASFTHAAKVYLFSVWVLFGLTHLIPLSQHALGSESTHLLLLLLGFAIPLGDVCAYTFGKLFRKFRFFDAYKIASNISPNKTFIGATGNLVGAGIGMLLMQFSLQEFFSLSQLFILTIVIGLSGALGDLMASMLKRESGVKNSGSQIIGHGGFLDRADSFIVATFTTYYLITFIA